MFYYVTLLYLKCSIVLRVRIKDDDEDDDDDDDYPRRLSRDHFNSIKMKVMSINNDNLVKIKLTLERSLRKERDVSRGLDHALTACDRGYPSTCNQILLTMPPMCDQGM